MSLNAFRLEFERHVAIVEQALEQLDDAQLLQAPYPGGSTVTALLTHISSFLTARFADLRFVDSNQRPWRNHASDLASIKSRAIVRAEWEVALATVRSELAGLLDSDLNAKIRLGAQQITVDEGLSRFGTHFAYHAGQVVLSARALLTTRWKSLQSQPLRRPLEHVQIAGPFGPIGVALALPKGPGPHPTVLIGQEGLGVTGHLLGLAHRFAAAGYLAVIPDLYSRDLARRNLHESEVQAHLPLARQADPAAAIAALPQDQQAAAKRVVSWFKTRETVSYQSDFAATLNWILHREDVQPEHVAAIGFSFGGGLVSQLAAVGAPLAAAVVVYGTLPTVEQSAALRSPLLGHFAGTDPVINAAIPALQAALSARNVEFSATIHPGTKHGFFNDTRSIYDPAAAERVWNSTLTFLASHVQATSAQQRAAG